jgi:hypothetical protein
VCVCMYTIYVRYSLTYATYATHQLSSLYITLQSMYQSIYIYTYVCVYIYVCVCKCTYVYGQRGVVQVKHEGASVSSGGQRGARVLQEASLKRERGGQEDCSDDDMGKRHKGSERAGGGGGSHGVYGNDEGGHGGKIADRDRGNDMVMVRDMDIDTDRDKDRERDRCRAFQRLYLRDFI